MHRLIHHLRKISIPSEYNPHKRWKFISSIFYEEAGLMNHILCEVRANVGSSDRLVNNDRYIEMAIDESNDSVFENLRV